MTDKEVLLLQTNESRGEFWQNVTGGVKKDEKFKHGASRELLEETGIDNPLDYIGLSFEFNDSRGNAVKEKVYLCKLNNIISDIKICSKEHKSFKWVEHKNITETNFGFYTNYLAYLAALKSFNGHMR